MVDVEQLVDPELEGLLRELASRPRSVFLRSSRKDAMRVLRSRTTEPLSGMAVSDALERELVTVHRAELAEILEAACRTKLLEGEREKFFNSPYVGPGGGYKSTPAGVTRARLERSGRMEVGGTQIRTVSFFGRAIPSDLLATITVPELAAIGHRVQPRDTWRLLAAFSYNSNKLSGSGRVLAMAVMTGWPSAVDAIRALEALALSEATEGHVTRALEYQEQALAIRGPYPLGEVNRLRCALVAVDERRAIDAASRLEEMIPPEHPLVANSCAATVGQRRMGVFELSPNAVRLALKLESRMGEAAREISRALH